MQARLNSLTYVDYDFEIPALKKALTASNPLATFAPLRHLGMRKNGCISIFSSPVSTDHSNLFLKRSRSTEIQ